MAARITRIEFAPQGAEPFTLRRNNLTWQTDDGTDADAGRTRSLLDRISSLRASGAVAYGAPAAELGLATPRMRITIHQTVREGQDDAASFRIDIGTAQGEGEAAWVPVRRSDRDVTLRYAPSTINTLVEYRP